MKIYLSDIKEEKREEFKRAILNEDMLEEEMKVAIVKGVDIEIIDSRYFIDAELPKEGKK